MSKRFKFRRRAKYVLLALAFSAAAPLMSFAACSPENEDDDETTQVSKVDAQLLKNGNFEFYTIPEAEKDGNEPVYLINTPDNWTHGGTSPYTMSGIINTNKSMWDLLSAPDLAEKLDKNNALNVNDSNYKTDYVDYNGMKSSDILYKDSYSALKTGSITSSEEGGETIYKLDDRRVYLNGEDGEYYFDAEFTKPLKEKIGNPGTHYKVEGNDTDGYYYMNGEEKVTVYKDEKGDFYLNYNSETGEYTDTFTSVLMLHNYTSSNHGGITQNYSSVTVNLPENTAAEISVWVKTQNLLFKNGNKVEQDRGAYIAVKHTVGGVNLDDFKITDINTEKLIAGNKVADDYNGWVQYTVYVNACDFAASTVTMELGLGETGYTVEGYAFFDDVTVKQATTPYDEDIVSAGARCTLSSDGSEKVFVADEYERNGGASQGGISDPRSSGNFKYLLDLASESGYEVFDLRNPLAYLGTSLTVDDDSYTSSLDLNGLHTEDIQKNPLDAKAKLPTELKNIKENGNENGIITKGDMVSLVRASRTFTDSDTEYASILNKALANVKNLPKADANSDVLLMLSARGAAYTSSFGFTVQADSHMIVSFWLKTSDMQGTNAATLLLKDRDNKDVSATFSASTTDVVTDLDEDRKDIYDGWVQCFFFIENNDTVERNLTLEFKLGNTAIKDTTISSYKSGWAMLANLQTLVVDDDMYSFTSTDSYSAELILSENEVKYTSPIDEAMGQVSHEIENKQVAPSTYKGVNGGSSAVKNNGSLSIPYDEINRNSSAGLINREYVENYIGEDWFKQILDDFDMPSSTIDAMTAWKKVFGDSSYQPLVIINRLREVGERKVINYGFIGADSAVAADTYQTVSVRVKVSEGAVAYLYLIDTSADKEVLSFENPEYSFYYDDDGNVLKAKIDEDASLAERKANVLYTLRSDGLYEDKDGKLYANTWNLRKLYKDETLSYYNENGEIVNFDDLDDKTYYYADAAKTRYANHFLATKDGAKIYEYKDGSYHYIVDGVTQSDVVTPFDTQYARYGSSAGYKYVATVDARYNAAGELLQGVLGYDEDGNFVANKWITVNFVIHTGSEEKNYRLELWSGSRDESGVDENGAPQGVVESSCVIFDYSYTQVSDENMRTWYEDRIIKAYRSILAREGKLADKATATSTENISYYEKLAKDVDLSKYFDEFPVLKNYTAHYYTFSLYDSEDFTPFNKDIAAEGTTGYEYDIADYEESLAYLKVKDIADEEGTLNIFADYAAVDQDIEFHEEEDSDDTDTDDTQSDTNVWLLASSILLVVALLFAIVAIFVRNALKKRRLNKVSNKNKYDHNKAVRTMKKLKIKPEEYVEEESDTSEKDENVEKDEPSEKDDKE